MRALIVGCGYVGLPLGAELVRRGHQVYGLRRSSLAAAELKSAGIIPVCADITRPAELAALPSDFDWVVNCTASGGGDADTYRQIYLEGSRNLLTWLAGVPLKKFVYTSSTSVYAQNDGSPVTEASPTEPEAGTARILVETEQLLRQAAGAGFPAVILRVAGIYGPARGHWFKAFLRGEAHIEGEGTRLLNMIHRDDVIGIIIAALERGAAGEILNAVDDEPVTQLKFFEWLAAALDRPLPPRVPADAEVWRKRGTTNKRVSNAKLHARLEYAFRHPDFRSGYTAEIRRMAAENLHA
jgi:nucleoside-diphosphate-sugar epimerase